MRWIRPEIIEVRLDNLDKIPVLKSATGIVVLSVSGSGIVSRPLSKGDPFLSRLRVNDSLAWTEYDGHVCYMPSEPLGQIALQLKNCFIAGTAIGTSTEESLEEAQRLKEKVSDVKAAVSSPQLRSFLMQHMYQKFRLPVLLFWLLVLVGNYLLSSRLGESLNAEYQIMQQNETRQRNRQEITSQQEKLITYYQAYVLPKSSVALDKIASVLPNGMLLTKMDVSGTHAILISGNSTEMSKILKFSESLKEIFKEVDIRSLEARGHDSGYNFELQIGQ